MTLQRLVIGFFVRLAVLYAVLIAAWPLMKSSYSAFHRTLGATCLSRLGEHGTVTFEPWPENDPVRDTMVVMVNTSVPDARIEKRMPISARYTGYFPTVVVISLILATPLPWPRRLRALGIGLLLVNLFIVAWLGVSIWDDISDPLPQIPIHGFILSPWLKSAIHFIVANVVDSLVACSYVVPVFLWIVAVFGRKDRERLLQPFIGGSVVTPSASTAAIGSGEKATPPTP
ncbi:MAG: hypothetical protein AABZ08_11170 [Planctomycetota bacterium]